MVGAVGSTGNMLAAAVGMGGKPTGDPTDKATIVQALSNLKPVNAAAEPKMEPAEQAGAAITSPKGLISAGIAKMKQPMHKDSDAESESDFSDNEDADANKAGTLMIPARPPPTQVPPKRVQPSRKTKEATPPVSVCPQATAGAAVTDWSLPGKCQNPDCANPIRAENLGHKSNCPNHWKNTDRKTIRRKYFL